MSIFCSKKVEFFDLKKVQNRKIFKIEKVFNFYFKKVQYQKCFRVIISKIEVTDTYQLIKNRRFQNFQKSGSSALTRLSDKTCWEIFVVESLGIRNKNEN